jgi:hypothetical protein
MYSFSGNCFGISPNFHIHVSVSDLYIPRVVPQTPHNWPQQILEIYKSLTDIRYECRNWEREHYNSVLEIKEAAQFYFWEYVNGNQTFILDSHQSFNCSAACTSKKFEKRIWKRIRKRIRLFKKFLIVLGGQRSGAKRRRRWWLGCGGPPALPVRRSGRHRQRSEEQPAQPPGGRPAVRRPPTTPDPGSVPEAGPAAPALAGRRRGVRHGE